MLGLVAGVIARELRNIVELLNEKRLKQSASVRIGATRPVVTARRRLR
jgi:hypothetical protein